MFNVLLCLIALLFPPRDWVTIDEVSVTYYASSYDERCRLGLTASGMRCVYDADVAALGPNQLAMVRKYYEGRESECGAFPLLPCWLCHPIWYGHIIRLCDENHCEVLRVADTGLEELEVDLPRGTWQEFGYDLSKGRFDAELQVLK